MGLVAEYELACEHLPLVDVARDVRAATLTVDVGQPNQGGPPPFVVDVADVSPETIEPAFDHSAFVDGYARIGLDDLRYRVRPASGMDDQLGRHLEDPDGLEALAALDTVVEHVEVTPSGWRQHRWFADRAAFDRYRSFWRENGDGITLYRLTDAERLGDATATDGLTDRQREALAVAHRLGYFEVPRTASLADVAAELGITASACSERLRRAQSELVGNTVAATGAYKRPHESGTDGPGAAAKE